MLGRFSREARTSSSLSVTRLSGAFWNYTPVRSVIRAHLTEGVCTMRFLFIIPSVLLLLAACGGGNSSSTGGGTETAEHEGTPLPTPVEMPTSTGEAAATPTSAPEELEIREPPAGFVSPELAGVQSECTADREALAVLSWRPSQPGGLEQQVHVLLGGPNFTPGSYQSSQELSSHVSTLSWEGLTPAATYYWRVATRIDGGWVVGDAERFSTESCFPLDPVD
jgi:hypothetical protein